MRGTSVVAGLILAVSLDAVGGVSEGQEHCITVRRESLAGQPMVLIDRQDGVGETVLTQGSSPQLSPDGSQVVFKRGADLRLIGADGQSDRVLVRGADLVGEMQGLNIPSGLWAPDGQSIVFQLAGNFSGHIGAIDVDGTNLRILGRRMVMLGEAWPSPFSPDGTKLLLLGSSEEGIGAKVLNLADGSRVGLSQRSSGGSWSPDGSMVAFTWADGYGFGTALEVVSVDGAERHDLAPQIRTLTGRSFEPFGLVTWAADGAAIAVRNLADGNLYAVQVDEAALHEVTAHFSKCPYPLATQVRSSSWGAAKDGGSGPDWDTP